MAGTLETPYFSEDIIIYKRQQHPKTSVTTTTKYEYTTGLDWILGAGDGGVFVRCSL